MPTRNLNILITGATSGIGEALAVYYAKTSAKNLFICGRNPERLKIVENKCRNFGSVVYGKIVDVTDKETLSAWISECNNIAKLNLVIANAGIGMPNENICMLMSAPILFFPFSLLRNVSLLTSLLRNVVRSYPGFLLS